MGVIDLNARVTALEEGAGQSEIIDQLEAAVTDLEETVNGNGETDFGLVGDVAELQAGGTPEVTTITTVTTGEIVSGSGGVYYEKIGNTVHVHVSVTNLEGYKLSTIFTLPEGCRPSTVVYGMANTAASLGNAFSVGLLSIQPNGVVGANTATAHITGDVWFMIPEPVTT